MRPSDISDYFILRRYIRRPGDFIRLRKSGKPFLDVTLREGGIFRLRPQDWHVFYGVFARDEYRLNGSAENSYDTVIDIGGHVGTFSVRVAPYARRVLSYEP